MKRMTLGVGGLAIALTAGFAAPTTAAGQAQEGYQLGPRPTRGLSVAPIFEGWWQNPDGTYTLSFGFYNPNGEEIIEVPIGPDNLIEPAEFNGMQPTHFPPVNYGGYNGRRERGAFAVTVPADFVDKEVVWTIRSNGKTERTPGQIGSVPYELTTGTMAMGSYPPGVRMDANGSTGYGVAGVFLKQTLTTKVGNPLGLKVWAVDDRSEHESGPVPLGVTWWKHQGPGDVSFSSRTAVIPLESDGLATTTATFSEPGEYVIRARVDNFRAPDSAPGDQCCWSNGYVRVTVTP